MVRTDNRPCRFWRSTVLAASLSCGLLALEPVPAWAGDAKAEARAAYDKGQAAFGLGDYHEAAVQFALADEIGPNPVALESAIKAAILASDPALAMTLAERSTARPKHAGMEAQADRAREKYAKAVGRVTLRCPQATHCTLAIKDEIIQTDEAIYLLEGSHVVDVTIGDQESSEALNVPGGGELDWRAPALSSAPPASAGLAPPRPDETPNPGWIAPPREEEDGGISPAWFFVGAGLTVAAAVPAIALGLSATSHNDDFQAGDDSAKAPGQDAQTLTNVMWGVTGALGVATVLVGVLAVDWSGDDGSEAGVGLAPNGVFLRGTL